MLETPHVASYEHVTSDTNFLCAQYVTSDTAILSAQYVTSDTAILSAQQNLFYVKGFMLVQFGG
jgi:hypothetical protein